MSSRRRRERKGGGGAAAARFFSDVREAVGSPSWGGPVTPRCTLCGSPRVEYCGLWYPKPEVQAKLLVPAGKRQVIGYALGGKCSRLPGVGRRVEAAILADFAALGASPLCN